MSDRIRWEPNGDGSAIFGYVGTLGAIAFRICAPAGERDEWLLVVRLTGSGERRFIYADDPATLKADAEFILSEFVSSLGASFGADAIVRWQDVRPGDLVLLDDELTPVESVNVCQKPWGDETTFTAVDVGYRLDNGVFVTSERHGDRFTAIRRTEPADDKETGQ